MGHRERLYAITRRYAPSPPPPNGTVAAVTAELRVAYPPGCDVDVVHAAIRAVLDDVTSQLPGPARTDDYNHEFFGVNE